MTDSPRAPAIIAGLEAASSQLADLARWLGNQRGFHSLVKPMWITRDPNVTVEAGPMIEWYVDAEYGSDRAISFALELVRGESEWIITSCVTSMEGDRQELLLEMPTRFAVEDDELVGELCSAARQLFDSREQVVDAFRTGREPFSL